MRVPLSWLNELLPGLPGLEPTLDVLDGLGLGIEEVHHLPGAPAGVVVALVEGVGPVSGSSHLREASVSDGRNRYSVICGAPNVKAGMRSALALPGARLAGTGARVEVREVMGTRSEAVLCSPRELGLFDYAAGIIEFASDAAVGDSLGELWPEEQVIELEVTPNRADAFSLLGVARDLAAKLDLELHHPAAGVQLTDPAVEDGLRLIVEDPGGCPRFTLQLIEGLTVMPSPLWLQRRLASLGLRPRNNVVDVTNYVTCELGQPSHAYDLRALRDNTIIVRRARPGEHLVALNEEILNFSAADLLITTPSEEGPSRPVAVAGVIGGLYDSVMPDTINVALEVAHFDPVTVRKTAKRLGIVTDAHFRFERGVDPNLPPVASARAAQLIVETAGGRIHPGRTDVGKDKDPVTIAFRPSRVAFLMDFEVPRQEQRRYLEALGCRVRIDSEDVWQVATPSWRFDMEFEEDLIEEVSRLHGYEHIGETVAKMDFLPPRNDVTHRILRELLAGMGFQEVLSYVFTGEDELRRAKSPEGKVRLVSPQGVERSLLRPALFPGLLQIASLNRTRSSLAVFEIGRVFGSEETERLAILIRGPWIDQGWRASLPTDFFVFKGLLETLARNLNSDLSLRPSSVGWLHPGVNSEVFWNGRGIGYAGRLHPEVEASYKVGDLFLAEIDLPLEGRPQTFSDIPRQPHAERDLAVIVPESVPYEEVRSIGVEAAGPFLESVSVFDIYIGAPVPEGSRSIALRFVFRHPDRALTDIEVDAFMTAVVSGLHERGFEIRA